MKLLFMVPSLTLILTGCSLPIIEESSTYMPTPKEKNGTSKILQGKIIDDFYHHPKELFSFKMPQMMAGERIEEEFLPNSPTSNLSTVFVMDDFGNLVRVEVITYFNEGLCFLNSLSESDLEEFLLFTLKTCVFDLISQQYPGTQLYEEKLCEIEGIGKACFAIIEIPGGSNMKNAETGRRVDSKRAYMISRCGNQLVALSTQESLLVQTLGEICNKIGQEVPSRNQMLYNQLIELRKSYKNQSN